jgi:hypothetical protein
MKHESNFESPVNLNKRGLIAVLAATVVGAGVTSAYIGHQVGENNMRQHFIDTEGVPCEILARPGVTFDAINNAVVKVMGAPVSLNDIEPNGIKRTLENSNAAPGELPQIGDSVTFSLPPAACKAVVENFLNGN